MQDVVYTNADRLVDLSIIVSVVVLGVLVWLVCAIAAIRQTPNQAEAVRRANARALRRAGAR